MKASLCLAGIFVAAVAFGQAPPFQCIANAGVPPIVRAEGYTELTGDLTLQCNGGTPTALGATVPSANITVFLNTQVTSRLLPGGFTEATLLIDEPASSAQLGCTTPGGCTIKGTGAGVNFSAPSIPNLYQAVYSGPNSVTFNSVPIDPGGPNGRVVRITNVRANANGITGGGPSANPVIASISASFPISNPTPTVAFVQSGLSVGAKASSNQYCSSLGLNGNSDAPSNGTTRLTFAELFPGAFRQKLLAGVLGANKGTESGTVFPSTAGLHPKTGLADTGTNLGATFINLQPGLTLTTPLTSNLMDGTAIAGNAMATSPTGAVVGNNLVVHGDSSGTAFVNFEIMARDPANPNKVTLAPTFTLGGSPSALQVPENIEAILRFMSPPQENPFAVHINQANLLFPYMTNLNQFATDVTPNATADPFLMAASIVGCVDAGNSLNTTGGLSPNLIEVLPPAGPGSSAFLPRVFNVPIVSSALPTSGVTVTANPPAPWLNIGMSDTTTPFTTFLSVNNATIGNYSTTLQFSAPGGISLSVPVGFSAEPGPWFTRYGFANSASYANTIVAPGEPFVVFGGDGFGPASIAGPQLDANNRAVTMLGNTQVLFDLTPTPLYYSVNNGGIGQVAGFAPFSLAGKSSTNVQVVYNGVMSPPVKLAVLEAVPGLFTADSSGGGQGSILNQDLSINSSSNPESVGNVAVFYGGGGGQTAPGGRDGALAGIGGPLAKLVPPVQVFIDGIAATDIPYAGPAPGLVEGVFQVNVRIPPGVRRNANVPVVVQIGDKQTQQGVTLATK